MRIHTVLATAVLAAAGLAQSPLVTLNIGGNYGNVGGGLYFDLQVLTTVTITRIDFRCGATTPTGTGSLDVFLGPSTYVGNVTNPALWTNVASATNVAVGANLMANGTLTAPFALGPGNYGVALQANGFSHSYTNGDGNSTPGSGTNQTYSTAEMVLRAGAAQNAFLSGGIFAPRVYNGAIHYTLGGNPISVASYQPYGKGCYGFYKSFYEFWPSSVFIDLGGSTGVTNSIRLTLVGGTYSVAPGTNQFFLPTATSPNLGLGADTATVISTTTTPATLPFPIFYPDNGTVLNTTQIEVNSNGCVTPAGSNGSLGTPSVAAFLNGQPRWCNWHNFDPSAGGSVTFDVDPNNTACYVTWQNVPDQGIAATSNTFQLAFFVGGDVEFRWQAMSTSGGGTWPTLVGWTPGNGALDSGGIDISASMPFSTQLIDNPPLALSLSNRPLLGTTPNMVIDDIPAGTTLGLTILSFVQRLPGTELSSMGMPNCFQHLDLDVIQAFFPAGTPANVPFPVPNNSALNGVRAYGQAATFSGGYNPMGVITSNGVRLVLGSL